MPYVQVLNAAPGTDTSDWYLHLGYKDGEGDYGDNGYYSHDDGTDDQCKDVGDAWVVLTIVHSATLEVQKPQASMDLWWDEVDNNALGLNPKWGLQVTSPGTRPDATTLCNAFHDEGDVLNLGTPPCTTQHPEVDEPGGGQPANYVVCQLGGLFSGSVHGHVDWGFGTYTGLLYFQDWQVPGIDVNLGDNDYDFGLVRPDQAGVTLGNDFQWHSVGNFGLTLEMDSTETIDNFTSPWWVAFRNAVHAHPAHTGDWTAAQALVGGQEAIAIGLIGIDIQHGPHAELHPIMGLAIHTQTTPEEDVWEVMARNWGDEGFCSQDQHFLPLQKLAFFFPNPDGATLDIGSATSILGNSSDLSWGAKTIPQGVVFTIKLSEPEKQSIAHGEIHLARTPTVPAPTPAAISSSSGPLRLITPGPRAVPGAQEKESGESLEGLVQDMSAARQKMLVDAYRAAQPAAATPVAARGISRDDSIVDVKAKVLNPTDPKEVRAVTPGTHKFDIALDALRQRQSAAMTSALGGTAAFEAFLNMELAKGIAIQAGPAGTGESAIVDPPIPEPTAIQLDVVLNKIAVPRAPIGTDPWAFDVFLGGKRQLSIPAQRYSIEAESSFSPLAPRPRVRQNLQPQDSVLLDVIGYNSTRIEGNLTQAWDLNQKGDIPIDMNVGLGEDGFVLHFLATNNASDQIMLRLGSVQYRGTQRKPDNWRFRIIVNDQSLFDVPTAQYQAGSPAATLDAAQVSKPFYGGSGTSFLIDVIAYKGEPAEGQVTLRPDQEAPRALRIQSRQGAIFDMFFDSAMSPAKYHE